LRAEARGDEHRFVTRAADLEEGPALVLELDLLSSRPRERTITR
jgi:hypothetical protein